MPILAGLAVAGAGLVAAYFLSGIISALIVIVGIVGGYAAYRAMTRKAANASVLPVQQTTVEATETEPVVKKFIVTAIGDTAFVNKVEAAQVAVTDAIKESQETITEVIKDTEEAVEKVVTEVKKRTTRKKKS